jgi:hypothetical protein
MEVGTGCTTGFADTGNNFPLCDPLADTGADTVKVDEN